jgi:hypothetical protein
LKAARQHAEREYPATFDERGWMIPPWRKYPDIQRYSIGWCMGRGEDYMCKFREWLESAEPDFLAAYAARYPEPPRWSRFYSSVAESRQDG